MFLSWNAHTHIAQTDDDEWNVWTESTATTTTTKKWIEVSIPKEIISAFVLSDFILQTVASVYTETNYSCACERTDTDDDDDDVDERHNNIRAGPLDPYCINIYICCAFV